MNLLITAAGSGGSNNLIRGIRRSNVSYRIIGTNCDKYILCKSGAEKNYLLPKAGQPDYIEKLTAIIHREKIDLLIPNSDQEVYAVSKARDHFPCRTFLPRHETIEICQDKLTFFKALSVKNIPVAKTVPVNDLDDLPRIFRSDFSGQKLLWCRLRHGSGSKAATMVQDEEQARFWIKYWRELRGVPIHHFLISEFLPGRDFAVQSIWKDGKLKLMKMVQRLSYLTGEQRPSGMSSTPQLAVTLKNRDVLETCQRAVRLLDEQATGNFCIDLKENKEGNPCLTEINIGRFFMINPIFNMTGKYNMAEIYLELAQGKEVAIPDPFDIEEGQFLIRELDTEPIILSQTDVESEIHLPGI